LKVYKTFKNKFHADTMTHSNVIRSKSQKPKFVIRSKFIVTSKFSCSRVFFSLSIF